MDRMVNSKEKDMVERVVDRTKAYIRQDEKTELVGADGPSQEIAETPRCNDDDV